jgi:beta-lactamase regulating signal transducer with metallopeptidase domain
MQFLSHIPFNMINNIGFLSLMLMVYECIKYCYPQHAKMLFRIGSWMQILGLVQFLVMLALPHIFGSISLAEWMSQKYIIIHDAGLFNLLPIIGVLYCSVLFFMIIKTGYQIYAVQKMKQNADFSQSHYYNQFIDHSKSIAIGLSKDVSSPITFGWWTPVILLPFSICNNLTLQEVETILMHELAHILRHDYILHIILTIVQTILFFNPIIYLFKKETNLQREIACDQFVVNRNIHKLDYMNALYKLALVSHSESIPTTMGALGTQNELLIRMKQLSNAANVSLKSKFITITLLSLFGIMLGISSWNLSIKNSFKNSFNDNHNSTIISKATSNKVNPNFLAVSSKKTSGNHLLAKKNASQKAIKNISSKASNNQILASTMSPQKYHDIENESYSILVKQTMKWIQSRQGDSYFAGFDESEEDLNYTVAEKLLMRAIISNYQLKRDILNNKLSKALDQQEAIDTLLNSKEFAEMKQFEKWTKEFLKQHPTEATAPIVY